jgi:hypothetical protein
MSFLNEGLSRLIGAAIVGGVLTGCASSIAQPGSTEEWTDPCQTSKDKLDDFGPGVEACRRQNAPTLDDLPPRHSQ